MDLGEEQSYNERLKSPRLALMNAHRNFLGMRFGLSYGHGEAACTGNAHCSTNQQHLLARNRFSDAADVNPMIVTPDSWQRIRNEQA
jgi:hypothetical protein